MSDLPFRRISPLEIAAGWVVGTEPPRETAELARSEDVRSALDAALLPALESGRCYVAFSGGRDSSVVLAAATQLARRTGLALPVPVTLVHRRSPAAREDPWQEHVIRHLGLTRWERLPGEDAADLLGPMAQRSLLRHGVVWPTAIHAKVTLFDAAAGGWLLTGDGGDEILGVHRVAPVTQLLHGWRPSRARVRLAAAAVVPGPLRRRMLWRVLGDRIERPWLRPTAEESFRAAVIKDEVSDPLPWHRSVRRELRRRAIRVGLHNLDLLAAEHSVRLLHPLLDRRVVEAIARRGGYTGFPTRTAALEDLFGGMLPADVLGRRGKAWFGQAAFGPQARRFVGRWNGEGVDPAIVDVDRLRQEWSEDEPHAGSLMLLQAAWLAAQGDGAVLRMNDQGG